MVILKNYIHDLIVFHPLTYEGVIDISKEKDPMKLKALKV